MLNWLPYEPTKRFDGYKPPVDCNSVYESREQFVRACEYYAWWIFTGRILK